MAELVPKKAKITNIKFTSEWFNPNSQSVIYYHEIEFSNGDKGNIGAVEQLPAKLAKGMTIWYTKDGVKIKKVDEPQSSQSQKKPNKPTSSKKVGYGKAYNPEDFLGYVWGYSKDLIIAGKTMQDVEELKLVANAIYKEVTSMLQKGTISDVPNDSEFDDDEDSE